MADMKKFLDAEGVKYLWSKINMQDYPNNETLMSVIEAIDETKADKSYVDDNIYNWHEIDVGPSTHPYIKYLDDYGNMDVDLGTSLTAVSASEKYNSLGFFLSQVSHLTEGGSTNDTTKTNKPIFAKRFIQELNFLIENNVFTLPIAYCFTANKKHLVSEKFFHIEKFGNYIIISRDGYGLTDDKNCIFINLEDSSILFDGFRPDTTLSEPDLYPSSKAVGEALALKADKTDLQGLATEEYVNNMISQYEIAIEKQFLTEEDAIKMAVETGLLPSGIPTAENEEIYTDDQGNIYIF